MHWASVGGGKGRCLGNSWSLSSCNSMGLDNWCQSIQRERWERRLGATGDVSLGSAFVRSTCEMVKWPCPIGHWPCSPGAQEGALRWRRCFGSHPRRDGNGGQDNMRGQSQGGRGGVSRELD